MNLTLKRFYCELEPLLHSVLERVDGICWYQLAVPEVRQLNRNAAAQVLLKCFCSDCSVMRSSSYFLVRSSRVFQLLLHAPSLTHHGEASVAHVRVEAFWRLELPEADLAREWHGRKAASAAAQTYTVSLKFTAVCTHLADQASTRLALSRLTPPWPLAPQSALAIAV